MAIQNISGTDLTLKAQGVAIGCAGAIDLTITTATSSATCRASGGWEESVAGRHSWAASTGGVVRLATGTDASNNKTYADFTALQIARTPVELIFGTSISGDTIYTGTAIITETKATSPEDGGAATWTISFAGTGPLVSSVNA